MDRVPHHRKTNNLQELSAESPLLTEHDIDERLCYGRQAYHQREDDKGREFKETAVNARKAGVVVLYLAKHGIRDALDYSGQIGRGELRKLVRTGVVSQTRRTEELTDYYRVNVAVNGVKQARGEELRAEGEKLVKRLPRVYQPRPPLREQPQQAGVYAEVEQLLGDERPHAEAVVSHRYADHARRYSGRQGGLCLGLEVNPYIQQRTLYDGQRVEDYAKAHHTHDGTQLRRIIEVGHERRRGV